MQTSDIALNLGGGATYRKFTFTFADLQTTSGSGAKALSLAQSIPSHGKVLGVYVKPTVAFAGGSLSAMTISIGKTGGSATLLTSAFDIFAAVSDTALQETALFKSAQDLAVPLSATFTPTGDTCANCTAGSVDVYIFFLNVTTP